MMVCIVADPTTGECNLFNEGGDLTQVRLLPQGMLNVVDQKLNNGQPPPRPSGLIVPRMVPPVPPVAP